MSDNRRVLSAKERELLELRGCSAVSWDDITVSHDFRPEQLRNVRFEGRTSIGSRTRISDSTIANYTIGNDCQIDDVLRMECRHASTFGEGVGVGGADAAHRIHPHIPHLLGGVKQTVFAGDTHTLKQRKSSPAAKTDIKIAQIIVKIYLIRPPALHKNRPSGDEGKGAAVAFKNTRALEHQIYPMIKMGKRLA